MFPDEQQPQHSEVATAVLISLLNVTKLSLTDTDSRRVEKKRCVRKEAKKKYNNGIALEEGKEVSWDRNSTGN